MLYFEVGIRMVKIRVHVCRNQALGTTPFSHFYIARANHSSHPVNCLKDHGLQIGSIFFLKEATSTHSNISFRCGIRLPSKFLSFSPSKTTPSNESIHHPHPDCELKTSSTICKYNGDFRVH